MLNVRLTRIIGRFDSGGVPTDMEGSLLNQGVLLMLVGMGTVFVFLTLLVAAMSVLSRVVMKFSPPPVLDGPSADEIVAITAAVEHHRRSGQV